MWKAASTCTRRCCLLVLAAGILIATAYLPSTATAARRDNVAPSTPVGLTVVASTSASVSLSWRPSRDNRKVVGYDLYRDGAHVGASTGTSATFGGLSCGTTYALGVAAYDAAGNRSAVATVLASTARCADTVRPTMPANLVQTGASASSISLTWSSSFDDVGVAGYGLYREGLRVATAASSSATFSGLSCGKTYTLGVDAYDAAGNRSAVATVSASTGTCPDTSPPSGPASLARVSASQTSISLAWAPSLDDVGVAGYGVYRDGTLIGSTASWSYTFDRLSCGRTYTLAVDAFDWAGNRSVPATISAATNSCPDAQPPTVPTGLSPGEVTATTISLSWSPSRDDVAVAGYGVYVDGADLATSVETTFVITGLGCGTSHTLGVDAVDAAGNRSARASIDVTTLACAATGTQYPTRGIYDRDFSPTGFDNIAAIGFNFIDSGPSRDFSQLAARGLKGFVWLGGYDNTTCTFRETDTWVREHVEVIAGNPGVGAYFIDDEPNAALCPGAPAQMKARSDLVKSIDPGPPTLLVDYKIDQLKLWAGTVDIIGLDKYPCKIKLNGCDYSIIDQQVAEAERLEIRYWGVVQAFGDDYYKLPTPEELHAQFERWRRTKMEGYLVFAWRYPDEIPEKWLANHPELQAQLAIENGA
jgi:chitodextrinase